MAVVLVLTWWPPAAMTKAGYCWPNVTRLRIPEHREPYPWARAWRPASRNDSKKTASYLGRGITIKLAAILQIEAAELLRGRPSTPRRK